MDLLTKDDLDLLAHDDQDGTHVSLFLPTHRVATEDRTDPLRWKNLLQRCETALTETRPGQVGDRRPARPRLGSCTRTAWEWQHMGDGLAMFLGRGEPRSYRLPFSVPELAVVGERYVTGPLLRAVTHDSDFLMLALSQRDVRLLQGTAERVEQVRLRDVPSDLREVMERPDTRTDSHARTLKAGRGAAPARCSTASAPRTTTSSTRSSRSSCAWSPPDSRRPWPRSAGRWCSSACRTTSPRSAR